MRNNNANSVFKHIDMSGNHVLVPELGSCWPWKLAPNAEGRPQFSLNGKKVLAYRIVYELVNGEPLGKRLILHQCDNPICCNPDHLKAGDHKGNMKEMRDRERHGQSKHVVSAIRKLASEGITHAVIAKRYGLGRSTVTEIVNVDNYNYDEEPDGNNDPTNVHRTE